MPNASVLEMKKQQVAELSEKLSAAITGVLVDYSGISVADDTVLRKELREAGVEYAVIKNTIIAKKMPASSGIVFEFIKNSIPPETIEASGKKSTQTTAAIPAPAQNTKKAKIHN